MNWPQSMRLDTQPGERVIFLNDGGYEAERIRAGGILQVGHEYTVERVEVGGWSSRVCLVGIVGGFNTVLFANAAPKEGE